MVDTNSIQIAPDGVYALAATPKYLFAAKVSGLYRSMDGGKTWQNTFSKLDAPQPVAATSVAVFEETVVAGVRGAIVRSEDVGETWQIVGLSSPPPLVISLVISPNYKVDGTIVAGTAEDGIFVSTDRGLTWIPWNFGLIDPNIFALAISPKFEQDGTIWAGTESGIFGSKNRGRSWQELEFPMDAAPVVSLTCDPTNQMLYAGTENGKLFLSDDQGINWHQLPDASFPSAINAISISSGKHQHINILLTDKFLRSLDDGVSWHEPYPELLSDNSALSMLAHPTQPDTVLIGCAEGNILITP